MPAEAYTQTDLAAAFPHSLGRQQHFHDTLLRGSEFNCRTTTSSPFTVLGIIHQVSSDQTMSSFRPGLISNVSQVCGLLLGSDAPEDLRCNCMSIKTSLPLSEDKC